MNIISKRMKNVYILWSKSIWTRLPFLFRSRSLCANCSHRNFHFFSLCICGAWFLFRDFRCQRYFLAIFTIWCVNFCYFITSRSHFFHLFLWLGPTRIYFQHISLFFLFCAHIPFQSQAIFTRFRCIYIRKNGGKTRKQKHYWKKIIVKFIVVMTLLRSSFAYRVFWPAYMHESL